MVYDWFNRTGGAADNGVAEPNPVQGGPQQDPPSTSGEPVDGDAVHGDPVDSDAAALEWAKQAYARLLAGYKVFGAEAAIQQDVFPGQHEWHGKLAYPMIDKILGGRAVDGE